MNRGMWKLGLWNIVLIGLLAQLSFAQDEPEDPDAKKFTRITISNGSGESGMPVVLPVYFTPQEGVQVGHLKISVTFVSANLKFEKVERGLAAEISNIDLKNDLKLGKNDKGVETSTVTMETSSTESPKEGIRSGVLAYITLKLTETARPATISLRTEVEAKDLKSKAVGNLKVAESKVQVFAPGTQPQLTCFFFSH